MIKLNLCELQNNKKKSNLLKYNTLRRDIQIVKSKRFSNLTFVNHSFLPHFTSLLKKTKNEYKTLIYNILPIFFR